MDCFQIVLLLLLISSCNCQRSCVSCCVDEQSVGMGFGDCGCQAPEAPETAMNRSRVEADQTAPYPFPPYPVLRE